MYNPVTTGSPALYIKILLLSFSITFLTGCNFRDESKYSEAGKDWPVYLGNNHSSHYSSLNEINISNIHRLERVWEYHTEDDVSDNRSQIQCNPVIIDGILYGTSPRVKVFALDASSGIRLWEFDPDTGSKSSKNVNRGVSYWQHGNDKRILFSSGPELFALNAETGELVKEFGKSGKVSLKEGLGEKSKDLYVVATSPGIVYNDLLIIGSRVSEGSGAAPGFIRAFDIRSGKLEWVFRTIPEPGEFGYETWPPEAYLTAGGANSWAGMSLDKKRGMVFISTGSAAFDFWGGNRKGANLFANCILALDAATGKRIWHFQTVHHDILDRDLPAPPNLVTVTRQGKKIDAVAQITKTGFVFLLNRLTGEALFKVEEKPVPASDLEGEEAWPTQPFPLAPPPFSPQAFTPDKITDISQQSHDHVLAILAKSRTGSIFLPPSTQGTVIFPGFDGGGEWGGAAIDPLNAVMYVNSNIMPWILTMVELDVINKLNPARGVRLYNVNCAVCHGTERQGDPTGTYPALISVLEKYSKEEILAIINAGKGVMPSFQQMPEQAKHALVDYLAGNTSGPETNPPDTGKNTGTIPYSHTGYNRFLDKNGYPAVKPPWGTISAIDLNEGTIIWQVPLGEFKELSAEGHPQTGTENYGGPAVTAGGILFIGASKDEYFRAFKTDTGEELWKYKLPAGGYATPSVYEAKGRQYVVIACGGGKMGTPSGNTYIAFALGGNK